MRVTVELHSMHLLSLCSVSPHAVGSVLAGWSLAYVMGQYSWSTAYWLMELVSVSMVIGFLYLLWVMMRSREPVGGTKKH